MIRESKLFKIGNFRRVVTAGIISTCLLSCGKESIYSINPTQVFGKGSRETQHTYFSSFNLKENPISEGGRWINGKTVGLDWTDVKTVDGVARGNPNYPDGLRDATALLGGSWGPDQTVQATVQCQPNPNDEHMEVEIRLRSSLSAHHSTGYEITFNCNKTQTAYMYIVRWNGAVKDFTFLAQRTGASWGVSNGDIVKAAIVGNVITAYVNGIKKMQITDSTYNAGAPGIGFDHTIKGSNENIGFTSISVSATDKKASKHPKK